jgi:hypothetical protein
MKRLRNERRRSENEAWQRGQNFMAVGSVKPAIATLDLSDYCAESEEETKEEKVTKDSRISLAATCELKYVS